MSYFQPIALASALICAGPLSCATAVAPDETDALVSGTEVVVPPPMGGQQGFGGQPAPGGQPATGGDPGFGGDPGMGGAGALGGDPMGGIPSGPCEPGDYLGLCSVCGPDGMAQVAESDAQCPEVDCGDGEVYALMQDGDAEICTRQTITLAPAEGNCAGLGQCRDPDSPEVCVPGDPEEVARVEGPCQSIDGCIQGTGPTIENAAEGTPCDGDGTCQLDGTCREAPQCEMLAPLQCNPGANGSTCLCTEGVADGGTPYCEILVREGNRTNCQTFCSARGSFCLGVWNERNDTCNHDDQLNCNHDNLEDYVCRCAAL